MESLGNPVLCLRVLERDPTTLEEALKVASRLEALRYGELEQDWDDVGRRRDKFVKTAVTSQKDDEQQQLTGVNQDLKKELTENRMELEPLRMDRVSCWRGLGSVAGTPSAATIAEPTRRDRLSFSTTSSMTCPPEAGKPRRRKPRQQFRSRVSLSTCRHQHQLPTALHLVHQFRVLSTRVRLDTTQHLMSAINSLDVHRNVDRTTTATTVINRVTSRLNVLSGSEELKEHQPQSQVREPMYAFQWVVTRVSVC